MGGWAPLGYDVKDRKLVVNETEAALVRRIFERFVRCRSVTVLARELATDNIRNRYGKAIDKGIVYRLLNNRVYIGDVVHKGSVYPGEHEPIVSRALWEKVHATLTESPRSRAGRTRAQTPSLLRGLIFGSDGRAMSPTHTRRGQKLYRYYVSQSVIKGGRDTTTTSRVPATDIERAVIDQLRVLLRSPEVVVATWRAARKDIEGLTETEVREALERLDPLWEELFPAEQARIVHLLVERVDISASGASIILRTAGLVSLASDLQGTIERKAA